MSDAINIEDTSIPLPITQVAIQNGRRFASEQPTDEKKNQVYLNTLAVCVVKNYMEMMDIPTHLTASDSWNPAMRLGANVADLKLPGFGHLECRPVRDANSPCYIPLDVPEDPIGVVVVKIDLESLQGTLLGFCPQVKPGQELPPDRWQSIDKLLAQLENINQPSMVVQLSQWFNNIFASDWQPIESVIPSNTRTAAAQLQVFNQSENSVSRAKRIDLQLADRMLGLVVQVTGTVTTEMDVRLRLYPADETIHIPAGLQLIVRDELGVACMEVKARDADNWIQLEFGVLPGENFTVTVALESESVTEKFAI